MDIRVDRVPASATWELRQAVLRPHETIGQLALPDDDQPSTGAFAAINEHAEVVSTARVAPARPPLSFDGYGPDDAPSWQLRGMATREDVRNIGIGSAVLGRVIEYVAERGLFGYLISRSQNNATRSEGSAGRTRLRGRYRPV